MRRNIPDILVAAMTMVHNKYTSSKSATQPRGINQVSNWLDFIERMLTFVF